jgi:competence protein ComEA
VLAAAIVQWRTDNGGFTSVDQLQEVSGIGPATYADVAPLIHI